MHETWPLTKVHEKVASNRAIIILSCNYSEKFTISELEIIQINYQKISVL